MEIERWEEKFELKDRHGMASWEDGHGMGMVEDLKCAPSLHGRVVHNATLATCPHDHYAIACVHVHMATIDAITYAQVHMTTML